MSLVIRTAESTDVHKLLDIYAYYVTDTAVTFEYEVPSLIDFQERMQSIQAFYPYLVAEEGGRILGYAYASAFHPRAAYAWSAEVTIYLDKAARGKGVGSKLYRTLENYLKEMGILNLNACIAQTDVEDEYLTNTSQVFHEKQGYQLVGTFHQSGYKFKRWYNMIWMEKLCGNHDKEVRPVVSFQELDNKESSS
ncbi:MULTISPECIES: GNAT family N-acetyltransferase [Streptococcus]|uniref:GNAT family N-acetyltransferase n=1 Tax=Streptococcus caledonicus TaxID=2614158 RepID=A0ABW0UBR8_9STRE|nr:GNAT family N-acetyltransferase [Streptococcus sp. S784/96/1]